MHFNGIYPIIKPGINDHLLCKKADGQVLTTLVIVNGDMPKEVKIQTGYLRLGIKVNLLEISQSPELISIGYVDETDTIIPNLVRLDELAIGKADGIVREVIRLEQGTKENVGPDHNANSRRLRLAFSGIVQLKNHEPLSVQLTGSLDLDSGIIEITSETDFQDDELRVIGYKLQAYRFGPNLKEVQTAQKQHQPRFARPADYNPTLRERFPDRIEELHGLLQTVYIPQLVEDLNCEKTKHPYRAIPEGIKTMVSNLLSSSNVPLEHRVFGLLGPLKAILAEMLLDTVGIEYVQAHPAWQPPLGKHLFFATGRIEYVGIRAPVSEPVFQLPENLYHQTEDILRKLHLSLSDKRSTTSPTRP